MPRVVVVTPYLNTRAFVHHGPPDGCRLVMLPPRQSVDAIASGLAVAGVVPVAGLKELSGQVDYLGEYGISCPGKVQSVVFFSRRPFEAFTRDCHIVLTDESLTSVRLLYLLFGHRLGFDELPACTPVAAPPDGELLIGDRALLRLQQGRDLFITDLAERWVAHSGYPMVFARWVVRKDAAASLRARLLEWMAAYAAGEPALLEQTARSAARATGLTVAEARAYLRGIRVVLGNADLRGQAAYLRELAEHGLDHDPAHRAADSPCLAG